MAARKKTEADEAQASPPSEEDTLAAAQKMREEYHAERHPDKEVKDWDDLPEAKQQRWLDKASGQGD